MQLLLFSISRGTPRSEFWGSLTDKEPQARQQWDVGWDSALHLHLDYKSQLSKEMMGPP